MEIPNLSKTEVGLGLAVGVGLIALRAVHHESYKRPIGLEPLDDLQIDQSGDAAEVCPVDPERIIEIPRRRLDFILNPH